MTELLKDNYLAPVGNIETVTKIGIVVVSHSRSLAKAAVHLASEMVPNDSLPKIEIAAGLSDTEFGTDAMAVAEAIVAADSAAGVLVFLDLGSAILSAEMALEFIDPEIAKHVHLSAAPLVEGLVAAVVTAATGASLETVAREALTGLRAKTEHLAVLPELNPELASASTPQGSSVSVNITATDTDTKEDNLAQIQQETESVPDDKPVTEDFLSSAWVIRNPHGLHARPAAILATGFKEFDSRVEIESSSGWQPLSISNLMALGLAKNQVLNIRFTGIQANEAQRRFEELCANNFGEDL